MKSLILLVALFSLAACAPAQRITRDTVDCAAPALKTQAGSLVGIVLDVSARGWEECRAELNKLALRAGAAVVLCAVDAARTELRREVQAHAACGWTVSCLSSSGMAELQLTRLDRWAGEEGGGP